MHIYGHTLGVTLIYHHIVTTIIFALTVDVCGKQDLTNFTSSCAETSLLLLQTICTGCIQ